MDHEPVLEDAVDVDNEKATDGLLSGLPQERSLNEILLDTLFIRWLVAAVAEANLLVQAYLLCLLAFTYLGPAAAPFSSPPFHIFVVGRDGFLPFVGLDDEFEDSRERGQLTLRRGVGTGRVGYARVTLCIPPRTFALDVFSVRLHEGDGTFPELGGHLFREVLNETVERDPEPPDLVRSEILTQQKV